MTPRKTTRILIVKLSSLGDLFHALPAVHALKKGLEAEIDWVTQPEYESLVRYFDDVKNVICFPRRDLKNKLQPFLEQLRQKRYDYVIDLQGLLKSAGITAAACGDRKIGPSAAREGTRFLYKETVGKPNKNRHAADELMDVVRYLNLPIPEPLTFPITFPKRKSLGDGLNIAICPCSRAAGKDWPIDRFAQLAIALRKNHNATIHLVGGPDNRTLCEALAAAVGPGVQNHAGKTSLIELGSLLQVVDLLITVDSGPMHMAAAIGTPTLALFGPTAPLRTGPYGKQHRVIESTFRSGDKKVSKKVRQQDLRYIEAISVDSVIQTAAEMIAG